MWKCGWSLSGFVKGHDKTPSGFRFFVCFLIFIDYLSYMKSSSDSTYDMKINVVMIRSNIHIYHQIHSLNDNIKLSFIHTQVEQLSDLPFHNMFTRHLLIIKCQMASCIFRFRNMSNLICSHYS